VPTRPENLEVFAEELRRENRWLPTARQGGKKKNSGPKTTIKVKEGQSGWWGEQECFEKGGGG